VKKVAIIGAGVGGLASAMRLAKAGFQVSIYEHLNQVGGRLNQFEVNGFKFDVGPTIVLMLDTYRDLFLSTGVDLDDYVKVSQLDPAYSIYYDDGSKFEVSSSLPKLIKQIEKVSPLEAEGYLKYITDVYHRFNIAKEHLLEKRFNSWRDFYNLRNIYHTLRLRTLNSTYASVKKHVREEKLRQALSFQTLYIGVSPYTGPSIYGIIAMIEIIYGVYYFEGGMYAIAKAMEKRLKELKVNIYLNHKVEEIIIEDGQAKGIKVNGQRVETDIVLNNVDFPFAVKNLIKDSQNRGRYQIEKINKMKYASSSFILYMGLSKKYKLEVHALKFAQDFAKNIADLEANIIPEDPSFYMYSPTQIDPSLAPNGKEVLYVLVPVPPLTKNVLSWDKKLSDDYQEKILQKLEKIKGLNDIRSHIEVIKIYTPDKFKNEFNLEFGATFGLKPVLLQSQYFRPQTKALPVKNLYFVGSSNHPGAGVPIVMISAKLACEQIIEDLKNE
jgi:phytoene desaturase